MGKLAKMKLAKADDPLLQEGWTMYLGETLASIAARRSDERGSFVRLAMARQLKLQRAKKKKT